MLMHMTDQIRLWEAERERMDVFKGTLFVNFDSIEQFNQVTFFSFCLIPSQCLTLVCHERCWKCHKRVACYYITIVINKR
jgi:hypothetical protein